MRFITLIFLLIAPSFVSAQTAIYSCNEKRAPFKLKFNLENKTVEKRGDIFPFIFDNLTVSWIEHEHDKTIALYVYEQTTEMLNYHTYLYDSRRGVYGSSGTTVSKFKIQCRLLD